ncbi:keratin-associated protein 10-7-like [Penaeus japonicus]|uniref:keratin-associated protein 10-7-like n=1 Tax=Penaeus japonicus TaxID=27405 RepID=UPI001C70DB2F|nr:keratin-associated protein 10-7-like [Penaeus japonicus]
MRGTLPFALLLALLQVHGALSEMSCAMAGGNCVSAGMCFTVSINGTCPEGEECCSARADLCLGSTQQCERKNGRCDRKCNRQKEKELTDLCNSSSCLCCTKEKKCKNTGKCKEKNGKCYYKCNPNEQTYRSLCKGDCVCCVEQCASTKPCEAVGGRCSESCESNEKGVSGLCDGNSCKCCVEIPTTTSTTETSGSSTSPTTTSTVTSSTSQSTSTSTTSSTSSTTTSTWGGCRNPVPECSFSNGQCRESCERNEREIEGCGNKCSCCVPENSCRSTSSECRNAGGSCELPSQSLVDQCDLVNLSLCPGCACCIDCSKQEDNNCRSAYDGSCKKQCSSKELWVSQCQAGCQCCGCETTRKCKNKGGICIPDKDQCRGKAIGKFCSGKDCTCCIPTGRVVYPGLDRCPCQSDPRRFEVPVGEGSQVQQLPQTGGISQNRIQLPAPPSSNMSSRITTNSIMARLMILLVFLHVTWVCLAFISVVIVVRI